MTGTNPAQLFTGVLLLLAPHMDDEVLACGGSLAGLPHKERVHVIYATNGQRSPMMAAGGPSAELEAIRVQEAHAAMAVLGIPKQNLHFLGLPDGGLRQQAGSLIHTLTGFVERLQPEQILAPFRYDRHPDHLALNRAALQAASQTRSPADVYEYFVYNRYRLLPGGDVRKSIRPDLRLTVDIRAWSKEKRAALLCYRSQTTLFYAWQTRPILPRPRVEEVSRQPEVFLKYDSAFVGASVFGLRRAWVAPILAVEPRLKEGKDRLLAWLQT